MTESPIPITPINRGGESTSARRDQRQERRHDAAEARAIIPLLLPARGQVGEVKIPASLTAAEWDILLGQLTAYRGGLVENEAEPF